MAIVAVSVFLMLPVARVAAHASFVDSNPVDGSVLATAPAVAELNFTEPVLLSASTVRLLHLGTDQEDDLVLSTAHAGTTVIAELPKLDRGAYILRYVVVDPADLHKTVGSISFGIGVAAPPSESGEQVDSSWLSVVLKAVTDGSLLLAVGAVVVTVLLVRARRDELDVAGRLAAIAAAILEVGWIGLLVADAATVGFENVKWSSLILSSDPGRRALIGLAMAIGLWFIVGMLRSAGTHAARWFVVRILAVIGAGFVVADAFGGHAGIGGSFVVGVVVRTVHLASLCLWIGAVAAMWLLTRRQRELRVLWPSVSALAAVGLALTGASGLLLSGRVAVTVTALLGTTYGQRIVIKSGLLVVLAVLGAVASRRIRRGEVPRRLPVELAVAGVAVVLAALLASASPARGEKFLALPEEEPQVVTSDVSDLTVSASIEPARPGANLVQVRVLNTRRPPPGPIESATIRIEGGDGSVVAERRGVPDAGVLEWADVAIPSPGTYRVEVEVTRSVSPVSPFVASWEVEPTPVARAKRVVSNRPWAPIAASLAAAWAVVVVAGWWATRRLSTRSAPDSTPVQ